MFLFVFVFRAIFSGVPAFWTTFPSTS